MIVAYSLLPLPLKLPMHGRDPGACRFKQSEMRKHLIHSGTLTPFPQQRRLSGGGVDDIEIHCWCRMCI